MGTAVSSWGASGRILADLSGPTQGEEPSCRSGQILRARAGEEVCVSTPRARDTQDKPVRRLLCPQAESL